VIIFSCRAYKLNENLQALVIVPSDGDYFSLLFFFGTNLTDVGLSERLNIFCIINYAKRFALG